MKRTVWEVVVVVLLLGVGVGVWTWWQGRLDGAVVGETERGAAAVAEARREGSAWAERLADDQGEAVARAFAAGIQPAVLGGRRDALAEAKHQLLQLPHVAFVHVLAADGAVLASSDDKYTTVGRADERAAWALGATAFARRASERPGVTEYATPLAGGAVLWLGYDTERLRAATRPGGDAAS